MDSDPFILSHGGAAVLSPREVPADVLGRNAPARPELEKLHDMAASYFRCKCPDETALERRPPVALGLRGPGHVFTAKPGFRKPRKRLGVDGSVAIVEYGRLDTESVYIDCVGVIEMPPQDGRPVLRHQKACNLRLDAAGQLSQSGTWYYRYAPAAVREFLRVAETFTTSPWQVFARSVDNCCCCGRALTDGTSRSRGVGPECLRSAALCFGAEPAPQ